MEFDQNNYLRYFILNLKSILSEIIDESAEAVNIWEAGNKEHISSGLFFVIKKKHLVEKVTVLVKKEESSWKEGISPGTEIIE